MDTEEVFDWNGNFNGWHTPPLEALKVLHQAARSEGFTPIYFTSYPVLQDAQLAECLARWVSAGEAHCGLHLHTWSTPPLARETSPELSYQMNLAPDDHARKLDALIEVFVTRFGVQPLAHRAGRYGAAPWVLDQLAERGVLWDFSPTSGFDARDDGGPDFTHFGLSVRQRQTANGPQRIFPVSGARKLRRTRRFFAGEISPKDRLTTKIDSVATVPVRLSPEGHSLSHMQELTEHLIARPGTLLTPTIHITTVVPGATPYAADAAEAASNLDTLTSWMAWAKTQGIAPISFADLQTRFSSQNA